MDNIFEVGKYLKKVKKTATFSLKRPNLPQTSVERIRDVFDPDNPMRAEINVPKTTKKVLADFHFGKKLPLLGCCGDCLCGNTESFSGDQIVSGSVYLSLGQYVPNSTVVYIDGVQATRNTDYVESDPAIGQITSLIPSPNLIVVSYVYNVGNCTESICVDERFECLGYTFISGLTTVFSDRYDRSSAVDPACGYYFLTPTYQKTQPFMFNGEATFGNNEGFWVGGTDKTVGQSVEFLAAVNLVDGSFDVNDSVFISLAGQATTSISSTNRGITSFQFTRMSTTTMRIRIVYSARVFTLDPDPFDPLATALIEPSGADIETIIPFTPGRWWLRGAQLGGFGFVESKAWEQFTSEPSGAQIVGQLSDTYIDDPPHFEEINREMALPAVNRVLLQGGGFEAIMVGAGLDNGTWGITSGNDGATGYFCGVPRDYQDVRFGFNCGVNGSSTVTYGGTSASVHWGISYPTLFGPPAGDGTLGNLIDYTQRVMAIDTGTKAFGHPSALRLRGQLAGNIWNSPVTAQLIQFPSGPLTMAGENGIQGGQILGSFLIPEDGTPVDFDVFASVPTGEQYIRLGVHVPNLQLQATQQDFYFGGPTFPNNVGSDVVIYFLRAEAIQSVACTTGPFCDDCTSTRCPPVQDGFNSDNATRNFGTGDFIRTPDAGLAFTYDMGTGTKVEFSGNTQKVSFNNSSQGFLNQDYYSPFDCNSPQDEISVWEATFDVRLSTAGASETGIFDFGFTGVNVSSAGVVTGHSFGISPAYSTTNITVNTWYSVRYRVEAATSTLMLRIWVTGTAEPTGWTFTSTLTSGFQSGFSFFHDTNFTGSSAFTTELRNVNINKVV